MATNVDKAVGNGSVAPTPPTLAGGYAAEDARMIDIASDHRGLQLADSIRAASWNKAMAHLNSGYCGPQAQKAMEDFASQWSRVDFSDIAQGKTAKALKPSRSKSYFVLPAVLEGGE